MPLTAVKDDQQLNMNILQLSSDATQISRAQRVSRRAALSKVGRSLVPRKGDTGRKRLSSVHIGYSSNLDAIGEISGFEGYLSDASENASLPPNRNNTVHGGFIHEDCQNVRRYLNTRIADAPGWTADPATLARNQITLEDTFISIGSSGSGNTSSRGCSTGTNRQSWTMLGRRLSLKSTIVGGALTRSKAPDTTPTSQTSEQILHSLQRANGMQPPSTRRRTSWFGSIKQRVKSHRSKHDNDAETMPIAIEFDNNYEDCSGIGNFNNRLDYDAELAEDLVTNRESRRFSYSVPCYPRLRSQPSLCSSNRDTADGSPRCNRDDVAFVPDTDNIDGAHFPASTPPRGQQSWTVRKPQFMLPYKPGTAGNAPYRVLSG
ncbi:hypothetical protein BX070DRAFT_249711 [Coemansia spiralis]|nr:hypothetical protein BX070DRAFT_249711 [Coemansia spiralis]